VYSLSNGAVSNDLQWALTSISRSQCYYRPDALDVLCAQLTRDVFAIVNFLYWHKWNIASRETTIRITAAYWRAGSVLNVQCIFRLLNGPKMAIFLSVQKGGLTYNCWLWHFNSILHVLSHVIYFCTDKREIRHVSLISATFATVGQKVHFWTAV